MCESAWMENGENCRPIGPELAAWSGGLLALLAHAGDIPDLGPQAWDRRTAFMPALEPEDPAASTPTDERARLWRAFLMDRTSMAGMQARHKLLESYWPLVQAVVHGLCRRLENAGAAGLGMGMRGCGGQLSREDMQQEGAIGLMAALDGFDPRHGVNFGHFARLKIRGAVLDALRRARRRDAGTAAEAWPEVASPASAPCAYRAGSVACGDPALERVDFDDVLSALTLGLDLRQRQVARLWLRECLSMAEIARVLKVHVTRVGQIRRSLLARWRVDPRVQALRP